MLKKIVKSCCVLILALLVGALYSSENGKFCLKKRPPSIILYQCVCCGFATESEDEIQKAHLLPRKSLCICGLYMKRLGMPQKEQPRQITNKEDKGVCSLADDMLALVPIFFSK